MVQLARLAELHFLHPFEARKTKNSFWPCILVHQNSRRFCGPKYESNFGSLSPLEVDVPSSILNTHRCSDGNKREAKGVGATGERPSILDSALCLVSAFFFHSAARTHMVWSTDPTNNMRRACAVCFVRLNFTCCSFVPIVLRISVPPSAASNLVLQIYPSISASISRPLLLQRWVVKMSPK